MRTIAKILGLVFTCAAICCCRGSSSPTRIIFDTDFGNDVDDALAADMLFKYADNGQVDLLAIMTSKKGDIPAEYADLLCNWYGHPEVAVARLGEGDGPDGDPPANYAEKVCSLTGPDGKPLFTRDSTAFDRLPAHMLYRKILSGSRNHSVDIVCTGFSTNLARLLDTQPDRWSPLDGKKLVAKKVRCLWMMAGDFTPGAGPEFNVVLDVPSARKVFEEWPGEIVTSPFDVGIKIKFPGDSLSRDFKWLGGRPHPVLESYRAYLPMPYDRPTWDLTSVLCAVEGDKWFTLSDKGHISVDDKGITTFTPDEKGDRRYMMVDSTQAAAILGHFVEMVTGEPESHL